MLESTAIFDRSKRFRYSLLRKWDSSLPTLAIIMLNPSRADAEVNDQTIATCLRIGKRWGFGAIEVVNLFAFRSAHPRDLRKAKDPVGKDNDLHILEAVHRHSQTLCAWGNHGALLKRDQAVIELLRNENLLWANRLISLGLTKQNQPRHPLYTTNDALAMPFHL